MKTLFTRSLFHFLISFTILFIAMGILLFGGYNFALTAWENEKQTQAYEFALGVLSGNEPEVDAPSPYDSIFLILDKDTNLIYSNKGRGLTIRYLNEYSPEYMDIYDGNNNLLGYYFLGDLRFADDTANQKFIEVMYSTLIIIGLLGIIIALIFSFILSRSISLPASNLAKGLNIIASGNHNHRIPETGPKELNLIASSANSLSEQLKTEKNLRDQWAHDITHDLRTPIASLQAQLEAMADGVLEMNQERILRNLEELKRMESLVKNLNILMRLEQPEMNIIQENISSEILIKNLEHRFHHLLEAKSINFKWENDDINFIGNLDLLVRALSNLFTNAIRHTKEKGTLKLNFKIIDNNIVISLFNSDSYIAPMEQKKIFDRLYRGEYARKTPGSGLGLSIAMQIAKIHDGIITVESEKSYGTTFNIILSQAK